MPIERGRRGSVQDRVRNFQAQINNAKEVKEPELIKKENIKLKETTKIQATIENLRNAKTSKTENFKTVNQQKLNFFPPVFKEHCDFPCLRY